MKFTQEPELTAAELTEVWTRAWHALPERWSAPVPEDRRYYQNADYHSPQMAEYLSAFAQGSMADLNHMVIMLQSVIEEQKALALDVAVFRAASYFVGLGLCTAPGRSLH